MNWQSASTASATTAIVETLAYRGRFAPSPTGRLHLGSLLAAVASYLRARAAGGQWLVRMEDVDPPRERAGAADDILRQLEAAGLEWDGPVLYQSSRFDLYRDVAESLRGRALAYRCSCSRRDIAAHAGAGPAGTRYPGICRDTVEHRPGPVALRLRVPEAPVSFDDVLQGPQSVDLLGTSGDFIIWRKESLPAYHLAVVIDDAAQGITEVVRGVDLLEATGAHLHLQQLLGVDRPAYLHVPVLVDASGQKLSKQSGARELTAGDMPQAVGRCLEWLGWSVPAGLAGAPPGELLALAAGAADFHPLQRLRELPAP